MAQQQNEFTRQFIESELKKNRARLNELLRQAISGLRDYPKILTDSSVTFQLLLDPLNRIEEIRKIHNNIAELNEQYGRIFNDKNKLFVDPEYTEEEEVLSQELQSTYSLALQSLRETLPNLLNEINTAYIYVDEPRDPSLQKALHAKRVFYLDRLDFLITIIKNLEDDEVLPDNQNLLDCYESLKVKISTATIASTIKPHPDAPSILPKSAAQRSPQSEPENILPPTPLEFLLKFSEMQIALLRQWINLQKQFRAAPAEHWLKIAAQMKRVNTRLNSNQLEINQLIKEAGENTENLTKLANINNLYSALVREKSAQDTINKEWLNKEIFKINSDIFLLQSAADNELTSNVVIAGDLQDQLHALTSVSEIMPGLETFKENIYFMRQGLAATIEDLLNRLSKIDLVTATALEKSLSEKARALSLKTPSASSSSSSSQASASASSSSSAAADSLSAPPAFSSHLKSPMTTPITLSTPALGKGEIRQEAKESKSLLDGQLDQELRACEQSLEDLPRVTKEFLVDLTKFSKSQPDLMSVVGNAQTIVSNITHIAEKLPQPIPPEFANKIKVLRIGFNKILSDIETLVHAKFLEKNDALCRQHHLLLSNQPKIAVQSELGQKENDIHAAKEQFKLLLKYLIRSPMNQSFKQNYTSAINENLKKLDAWLTIGARQDAKTPAMPFLHSSTPASELSSSTRDKKSPKKLASDNLLNLIEQHNRLLGHLMVSQDKCIKILNNFQDQHPPVNFVQIINELIMISSQIKSKALQEKYGLTDFSAQKELNLEIVRHNSNAIDKAFKERYNEIDRSSRELLALLATGSFNQELSLKIISAQNQCQLMQQWFKSLPDIYKTAPKYMGNLQEYIDDFDTFKIILQSSSAPLSADNTAPQFTASLATATKTLNKGEGAEDELAIKLSGELTHDAEGSNEDSEPEVEEENESLLQEAIELSKKLHGGNRHRISFSSPTNNDKKPEPPTYIRSHSPSSP